MVVVIGQRLQHGEARFLLAVLVLAGQLDDLGSGVFLVDKGALKREIDEARDNLVSSRSEFAAAAAARAKPAATA